VAQAYLTDPSIASRMVVAGIFSFSTSSYDTLAAYLVSKNCRFVQWGRTYSWGETTVGLDTTSLANLPANRMVDNLRYWLYNNRPRLTFSDLAPLVYLFDKQAWKTTNMVKVSSRLVVQPASDITFDFLDIPVEANDWDRYQTAFFTTLLNDNLYQPKQLPATFDAEAYSSHAGTGLFFLGPTTGPSGVAFPTGAWTEYKVNSPRPEKYTLTLRYRSVSGGRLSIGFKNQADAVAVAIPASSGWTKIATESISFDAGVSLLRIGSMNGKVDLSSIEIQK
jgi:hypothetical protein